MSELGIRKIVKVVEEMRAEMGRPLDSPVQMIAVAAVVANPWAGQGFVENLRPKILEIAPGLGREIVTPLIAEAGGADKVEAYGKAAVVGVNGEIEQASGLIHTLRFGNQLRDAVGGTAYLSFTNKRGAPGCAITIPMMHKVDVGMRSHYITMEFTIGDAPGPDEIVVALGVATGGRALPRIGDRYQDIEEMGYDPETRNAPA